MERIGVLHDEFPGTHDTEARPDFVTELSLDLVVVHRKLAVALQLAPGNVGDHLLMRGPEAESAVVPVGESQQLRAEMVPSTRFRRLHNGHQQL
jgi:hypothetical protein